MKKPAVEDRWLQLGKGTAQLPERLLLAHASGNVLFITGAGTSLASGLPDFRDLVLKVYERLDLAAHAVLLTVPRNVATWTEPAHSLSRAQTAELRRFVSGDYDVVLGMLERRMDGSNAHTTKVRDAVCEVLRNIPGPGGVSKSPKHSPIHSALAKLADRGRAATIATTNFDRLLQTSAKAKKLSTYALGAIPRPGRREDFAGVLHIHGALASDAAPRSDLVVTDRDFGEYYLRRRVVPDFIYDAARLYHLVLVGYSANDAPMRYLLNAVAADGSRFTDLRERFAFVGMTEPYDEVSLEDWRGRGITPIPYSSASGHVMLAHTLTRWATLSAINGKPEQVDKELRRIVRTTRATSNDADRDLFDHLVRRAEPPVLARIARLISQAGASVDWLDAVMDIGHEIGAAI